MAFLPKAGSNAMPDNAWPRAVYTIPAFGVYGKCRIGGRAYRGADVDMSAPEKWNLVNQHGHNPRIDAWEGRGPTMPPGYTCFRSISSFEYGFKYTCRCTHSGTRWRFR